MSSRRPIRIANCSGFYGDRLAAAREMVEGGPIDVLSGDWLAELTMGILLRDKLKDPSRGYARTLLPQLQQVLAPCLEAGTRIVSNAGGTHPTALAEAVAAMASSLDLPRLPRIAVVSGDDLTAGLSDLLTTGELTTLSGAPWTPSAGMPVGAYAYLGAAAVRAALDAGADIVLTGRVTDAALVVGPAAWWHGWRDDDLDALAGALVAGHVIECGAQATGGNVSGFDTIPGLDHVGFPIAEIAVDGESVITKHPGTGGAVTTHTVTAQLLYEVGGPRYLSPDVVARLDTVRLEDLGDDRVRVHGVRGEPPPPTLKAGALLLAGHRNEVSFVLGGDRIEAKAAALSSAFWSSLGGRARFADTAEEVLRGDHPDVPPVQRLSFVTFRAFDPDPDAVGKRFGAKAVELALASVPGLTLRDLPGPAKPVAVFDPFLVPRDAVPMTVTLDGQTLEVAHPAPSTAERPPIQPAPPLAPVPPPSGVSATVPLDSVAAARSGDKAGDANVGFYAWCPEGWPAVDAAITEDTLRAALGGWDGPITRHPLPNLGAVNVLLHGFLGRGVAANLSTDPQAKCLAEALRTTCVTLDTAWIPDRL